MKKQIITVCLAVVMALSIPVASSAADNSYKDSYDNFKATQSYTAGHYKDVKSSDWYYKNVKNTYETGLMVGTDSRHFSPKGNVTWAQAVALLARIHSIYKGDGHVFAAGSSAWYVPYVDYAVSEGIFSTQQVYGSLNDVMSRAAFVETLSMALPDSAYAVRNNIGKYDIPDVSVNAGYYSPVMKFYQAGILSGSNDYGFFEPYSQVSRAECAAIVTRIAAPALRNSFTLKPNPTREGVYYSDDGAWITILNAKNPKWVRGWAEPDWDDVYMYPSLYPEYFNKEWARSIDWNVPDYDVYVNDQYIGEFAYWNNDNYGTSEDGFHYYLGLYDRSIDQTDMYIDDHGHILYDTYYINEEEFQHPYNKPGC